MIDTIPLDLITLLMFIVPGYFVVWSFHKANGSEAKGDFERLIFSLFWAVVMILSYSLVSSTEQLSGLLTNPFAVMILFSLLGIFFGYTGSEMVDVYKTLRRFYSKK